MNQDLEPVPNLKIRVIILILLSVLALIGSTHILSKLSFILSMTLMVGTFRRFRISEKSLKHRWTIGFVPLPHQQWKLKRYSYIEVVIEPATGIIALMMLGAVAFVYGWIVDKCFSWIGGTYQIWLNNSDDDRLLAWQGNSQSDYENNLKIIESLSGFRVTMR